MIETIVMVIGCFFIYFLIGAVTFMILETCEGVEVRDFPATILLLWPICLICRLSKEVSRLWKERK